MGLTNWAQYVSIEEKMHKEEVMGWGSRWQRG